VLGEVDSQRDADCSVLHTTCMLHVGAAAATWPPVCSLQHATHAPTWARGVALKPARFL